MQISTNGVSIVTLRYILFIQKDTSQLTLLIHSPDTLFLELAMHSAANYRHSRRSACDRCRGFKLRCERDHLNGMSCERCIKAQVRCTTSVNQPLPVYQASAHSTVPIQTVREGRYLDNDQAAFPLLHRSSSSKVRKPAFAAAYRRPERQPSDCWRDPDEPTFYPVVPLPTTEEKFFSQQMPPECPLPLSYEHFGEQQTLWLSEQHHQLVRYFHCAF